MRDVLDDLRRWYAEGTPFALATVVKTWKSAPRQVGASMAVSSTGEAVGSVSGGCVEGAVYALGEDVMADGTPKLQRYGVSDDDAFEVGLTCGGVLDVFVQAVDPQRFPELPAVAESIAGHEPVAVATVIDGPGQVGARLVVWPDRHAGTLGSERLDQAVVDDARGMLDHGSTGTLHLGPHGERRLDDLTVFVESFAPPPKMLVFGAIDFAAAVARIGKFLGYHVTVCDARPVFATPKRFPDADEVVVEWPHKFLTRALEEGVVDERTVMCVLTHDPKFDVPLLQVALRTRAGYIGAMGSRRTHEDRLARLREAGMTEAELARLSSPIGLDIGARTPEETAVSIAAEITAARWGGSGERLGRTDGPIHKESLAAEPALPGR
ncbi:MAG TPA: XdhC/CoxI family protein [Motilibacteraceae bacterium]|nr:XdhC/CoxI family protein [Motilibacteraceae bacterium]